LYLPRFAAVTIVVLLAFGVIFGLGTVMFAQVSQLAGNPIAPDEEWEQPLSYPTFASAGALLTRIKLDGRKLVRSKRLSSPYRRRRALAQLGHQ
jgi:hypothetical protein